MPYGVTKFDRTSTLLPSQRDVGHRWMIRFNLETRTRELCDRYSVNNFRREMFRALNCFGPYGDPA